MDSVYFALTLLTVIWLVVWFLCGEQADRVWWPFDLKRETAAEAAPTHPASAPSQRDTALVSWKERRIQIAPPPVRATWRDRRPAPTSGWRGRSDDRRPR